MPSHSAAMNRIPRPSGLVVRLSMLLALLLLSACAAKPAKTRPWCERADLSAAEDRAIGNCPAVALDPGHNQMSQFTVPAGGSEAQRLSTLSINTVSTRCRVADGTVTVTLDLGLAGTLGPAASSLTGDERSFAYPYVLTVMRGDGTVAAREIFTANIVFSDGMTRRSTHETISHVLPMAANGTPYRLIVGFQPSGRDRDRNQAAIRNLLTAPLTAKP